MSTPEHVPVTPEDAPRVGDLERFPGQRRPIKRHAEMARFPHRPYLPDPAPDASHERVRSRSSAR